MRWVIRIVRGVFLLALGLVGLAAAVVGTGSGRQWAAVRLADALREQALPVEIDGLRWPLIGEVAAERVAVRDAQGVWLAADEVRVGIRWAHLLDRRVSLPSVSAEALAVSRTPARGVDAEPGPSTAGVPWPVSIGRLAVECLHLDAAVAGVPVTGRMHGAVSASGPTGLVQLAEALLSVDGELFGVSGSVGWNAEAVSFPDLAVSWREGEVRALGRFTLADRQLHARLDGRNLLLDAAAARFNQPVAGRLDEATAEITWQTNHWSVEGRLTLSDPAYANVTAASARLQGAITGGPGQGGLSGSWTADATEVAAQGRTASTVRVYGRWGDRRLSVGVLASGSASPSQVSVSGDVQFAEGRIHGEISEGSVLFRPEAVRLAAPAAFEFGDGRYRMSGVQVEGWGSRANATVVYDGGLSSSGSLEVPDLARLGVPALTGWQGRVRADWTIHLGAAPSGTVQVSLGDLSLEHPEAGPWIPTNLFADLDLAATGLAVRVRAEAAPFDRLGLEGFLNLPWQPRAPWVGDLSRLAVNAEITGEAALGPLVADRLTDWQSAEGVAAIAVALRGPVTNLAWSGALTVTNAHAEDLARGWLATNVSAVATADSDGHVGLTGMASDGFEGWIRLAATAAKTNGTRKIEGRVSVDDYIAARVFGGEIPVDGLLALEGAGRVATLTGRISARPLRFKLPPRLPPSVRGIRVVDLASEADADNPRSGRNPRAWPVRIDTDIRVQARSVQIDGQRLRTEWNGSGRVSGTLPSVAFGGSVGVVRGNLMFLGRRFVLRQGDVMIPSGGAGDPVLAVVAETRVAGATIQLSVEGPAGSPRLNLSADPPMERSEILSRILFGKPDDAVSPWQLAYLAYALDVIDGGGPLLQKLDRGQTLLGFDQVSLKQDEDDAGVSAVQFGRRVNQRVYLEGQVGFNQTPDVFAVEAELTPTLILRTETSPRIREGIGLYWRRDY